MKHLYGTEVTFHFLCGACKGRWGISVTGPDHAEGMHDRGIHCPNCGSNARIEQGEVTKVAEKT